MVTEKVRWGYNSSETKQPTKLILREGYWNLSSSYFNQLWYCNEPWLPPRGGQNLRGCRRWDQCQRMMRCRNQNLPRMLQDFRYFTSLKYKLVHSIMESIWEQTKSKWNKTCHGRPVDWREPKCFYTKTHLLQLISDQIYNINFQLFANL